MLCIFSVPQTHRQRTSLPTLSAITVQCPNLSGGAISVGGLLIIETFMLIGLLGTLIRLQPFKHQPGSYFLVLGLCASCAALFPYCPQPARWALRLKMRLEHLLRPITTLDVASRAWSMLVATIGIAHSKPPSFLLAVNSSRLTRRWRPIECGHGA